MLGKLLTSLGLGQQDLIDVTVGCVDRINRNRPVTSPQDREAVTFALLAMVDELRDRDVATAETAKEMRKAVEKIQQPK